MAVPLHLAIFGPGPDGGRGSLYILLLELRRFEYVIPALVIHYLIYSDVAKIRLPRYDGSKKGIPVATRPYVYPDLTQAIERVDEVEPFECGVDIKGNSHDEGITCVNEYYDNVLGETYCRVNYLRNLEYQRDSYEWLSSMFEFYWQNGIEEDGLKFLERSGFVYHYT
jgi:hypothetical protein